MTEHKYTDEEVIKAYELCTLMTCSCTDGCPYRGTSGEKSGEQCFVKARNDLFSLLNRQKAEVAFWMDAAANAKKEAVKEFADRMKERMNDLARIDNGGTYLFFVGEEFIDALVKEFTEEKT